MCAPLRISNLLIPFRDSQSSNPSLRQFLRDFPAFMWPKASVVRCAGSTTVYPGSNDPALQLQIGEVRRHASCSSRSLARTRRHYALALIALARMASPRGESAGHSAFAVQRRALNLDSRVQYMGIGWFEQQHAQWLRFSTFAQETRKKCRLIGLVCRRGVMSDLVGSRTGFHARPAEAAIGRAVSMRSTRCRTTLFSRTDTQTGETSRRDRS